MAHQHTRSHTQMLQTAINQLVDTLEEVGDSAIAHPRTGGGWEIRINTAGNGEEPPISAPDWERMHLVQAHQELQNRGWHIPENAFLANDRHGGWAHHPMPTGDAWTAPIQKT